MQNNTDRFVYLDSIRGIAAVMVMLQHCFMLNNPDFRAAHFGIASVTDPVNFVLYCMSKLRESGRSAVMLFFVLSGFVLAYSLQKTPMPYASYVMKRVFRIYPAFVFAILGSYAIHYFVLPLNTDKAIAGGLNSDNQILSLTILVKHLALCGLPDSRWLDFAIWSLVHEMRISLVFPLILLSVRRYQWRVIIGYWLFSVLCSMSLLSMTGNVALGYEEDTFAKTFLDTGFFTVFFAAGAYLATERERVALNIAGTSNYIRLILLLAVACCLLKADYNNHTAMGSSVDYIRGVGALGLISLALGSKTFSQILSHSVFTWLGRISYSLYLIHVIIIYVIIDTIGESWSVLHTSIVVILLSLAAGEAMARYIEIPAIEMGRRLCSRTKTAHVIHGGTK